MSIQKSVRLLYILTGLCIVLSLTACAPATEPPPTPTAEPTTTPTAEPTTTPTAEPTDAVDTESQSNVYTMAQSEINWDSDEVKGISEAINNHSIEVIEIPNENSETDITNININWEEELSLPSNIAKDLLAPLFQGTASITCVDFNETAYLAFNEVPPDFLDNGGGRGACGNESPKGACVKPMRNPITCGDIMGN